jgi:Holliday junction resolvase
MSQRQKEKYLERQIRDYFNYRGVITIKSNKIAMTDIIAFGENKTYMIEVKKKGLKPKPHQLAMIDKLNKINYIKAFWVDNFEDFLKEVEKDFKF